jgi:hypothetical protein
MEQIKISPVSPYERNLIVFSKVSRNGVEKSSKAQIMQIQDTLAPIKNVRLEPPNDYRLTFSRFNNEVSTT